MKQPYLTPILVLSLALSACAAANLATPDSTGPTKISEPGSATPVTSITTTPEITPTDENCAYMWASHELPDLSQKLAASLQAVDPNLTGRASAYGEDCVYADGHSTFSAMETDFQIKVSVPDLQDENALGNWVIQAMDVINQLPPAELSGPQPGRVQFEFDKSVSENLFLNVPIDIYRAQAAGSSGADVFKLFNNNP